MAQDATRQHYKLATGSGIAKGASGPSTTPKYARGGLAKAFTKGVPTSAAKNVGTVKTTNVTKVAGAVPGHKIHGASVGMKRGGKC